MDTIRNVIVHISGCTENGVCMSIANRDHVPCAGVKCMCQSLESKNRLLML